jgi:hypothetical protein
MMTRRFLKIFLIIIGYLNLAILIILDSPKLNVLDTNSYQKTNVLIYKVPNNVQSYEILFTYSLGGIRHHCALEYSSLPNLIKRSIIFHEPIEIFYKKDNPHKCVLEIPMVENSFDRIADAIFIVILFTILMTISTIFAINVCYPKLL